MEDNTKNSLGDSSDDDSFGESTVQLGVIAKESNALFLDSDWRNWDGGKIGGRPVWFSKLYLRSF